MSSYHDPELEDVLQDDELRRLAAVLSATRRAEPPLDDAFQTGLRRQLMHEAWAMTEGRPSWWSRLFAPPGLAWAGAIADRYRSQRPSMSLDDFHDLSIGGPALDDVAAHRDEIRRIWALVEALPSQLRTALVLKFQEDMKIEDIAVAMGKSAGAVKLLIHRGVTRLRDEADTLRPVE